MTIEIPIDQLATNHVLASTDGYQHVVDVVEDMPRGYTRVWVNVMDDGYECMSYDKTYYNTNERVEVVVDA